MFGEVGAGVSVDFSLLSFICGLGQPASVIEGATRVTLREHRYFPRSLPAAGTQPGALAGHGRCHFAQPSRRASVFCSSARREDRSYIPVLMLPRRAPATRTGWLPSQPASPSEVHQVVVTASNRTIERECFGARSASASNRDRAQWCRHASLFVGRDLADQDDPRARLAFSTECSPSVRSRDCCRCRVTMSRSSPRCYFPERGPLRWRLGRSRVSSRSRRRARYLVGGGGRTKGTLKPETPPRASKPASVGRLLLLDADRDH